MIISPEEKIGDTLFGQLTAVIGEIPATILLWGIIAVLFYFLFDLNRPLSESAVFIKKKVAHFCASKTDPILRMRLHFSQTINERKYRKRGKRSIGKNITNHPIDSVIGGNEIKGKSKPRTNRLPPINLLEPEMGFLNKNIDVQSRIDEIESAMEEFGTPVKVIGYSIGPAIIQYQVVPWRFGKERKSRHGNPQENPNAQVAQMERDLAVRMGVANLSIQAPVLSGRKFYRDRYPQSGLLKVRLRP